MTGSCHLLEAEGARAPVDCGAFQGSRALFDLNRRPFGSSRRSRRGRADARPPRSLGTAADPRPPGLRGPIHALPATGELCEHLLLDVAKLQREDAERDRRHGRCGTSRSSTTATSRAACLLSPFAYEEAADVADSASRPGSRTHPRIGELPGGGGARRLVFSGDVGNAARRSSPTVPVPEADLVFMEATYGDRHHLLNEGRSPSSPAAAGGTGARGQDPRPVVRARADPRGPRTVAHLGRDHTRVAAGVRRLAPRHRVTMSTTAPEELSQELLSCSGRAATLLAQAPSLQPHGQQ